jgi:outer membrane protein assembly factor BamE (lipoprotein component of BamABCDE complex)
MKKHTTYFSLFALVCASFFVSSISLDAQQISREDFDALAKRVEQVEASVRMVKNTQIEGLAAEAVSAMPMDMADKESLIVSVVNTIQAKEESANFPWMDAAKWASLKKGMSPEDVVALLGKPTLNEPSMHKRVDFVYTYQGRRVATAKKVEGIIRFYKGKAIEVEAPVL